MSDEIALRLSGTRAPLPIMVLVCVLMAAIFIGDLVSPLGYMVWVMYFLPLVLTTQLLPHLTNVVLVGCSALLLLGFFFSRPGLPPELSLVSRGLGLFGFWFTAYFLLRHRKALDALRESANRYQVLIETMNRERAEAALKDAQERFKSIFESSQDAIAYATLDGTLLEVNEAFLRLIDRSREDVLSGRAEATLWQHLPVDRIRLERLLESATPFAYEDEYRRHDGARIPVHVNVFVVRGRDGVMTGVAAIIRDITERKQAEAELQRTTDELREKHRALAHTNELLTAAQRAAARAQRLSALGQFAATVAHKIGTPLTALSGHVQLLAEDASLTPQARSRLRIVEAQIDRTSKIIQDLLVYARRPDPVRTMVDVAACLKECLALFRTECERQHVTCSADVTADLPAVEADRQQLQEVFNHLIDNALQAMPSGGGLSVRAFLMEPSKGAGPDGRVSIEIADTGCGIDPDHLAQIFQPFFTTKKSGQGTGLGLAIVQETIRSLGGQILVESEPGKGTRFVLQLPIAQQATS